jgi:hypothetical protein
MAVLEGRLPRPVASWRQSERNTRSIVPRGMRHSLESITVAPSAAKRIFLVSRPLSLTKQVPIAPAPGLCRSNANPKSRSGIANEQSSMLSLNVEIMQDNKKLIPIISTIRMQRFNDSLFGRGEPVYEFSPVAPSTASELGGIFCNWEKALILQGIPWR